MTLAVVASYQAVGSLLVVGLLLAPAVAAGHWTTRIPTRMALAAALGIAAVFVGLLVSWHAATAAGASVAATAIAVAGLSGAARAGLTALRSRPVPASPRPRVIALTSAHRTPPRTREDHVRSRTTAPALLAGLALALTACSTAPTDAPATDRTADEQGEGHGAVTGAAELSEPRLA